MRSSRASTRRSQPLRSVLVHVFRSTQVYPYNFPYGEKRRSKPVCWLVAGCRFGVQPVQVRHSDAHFRPRAVAHCVGSTAVHANLANWRRVCHRSKTHFGGGSPPDGCALGLCCGDTPLRDPVVAGSCRTRATPVAPEPPLAPTASTPVVAENIATVRRARRQELGSESGSPTSKSIGHPAYGWDRNCS